MRVHAEQQFAFVLQVAENFDWLFHMVHPEVEPDVVIGCKFHAGYQRYFCVCAITPPENVTTRPVI